MKLIEQLLREAGADVNSALVVVPKFGGYFKRVNRVEEYTSQEIVVFSGKSRIKIAGEGLIIEKYFEQDLFIKGRITGVGID